MGAHVRASAVCMRLCVRDLHSCKGWPPPTFHGRTLLCQLCNPYLERAKHRTWLRNNLAPVR